MDKDEMLFEQIKELRQDVKDIKCEIGKIRDFISTTKGKVTILAVVVSGFMTGAGIWIGKLLGML